MVLSSPETRALTHLLARYSDPTALMHDLLVRQRARRRSRKRPDSRFSPKRNANPAGLGPAPSIAQHGSN
jgi:hypothetical protein